MYNNKANQKAIEKSRSKSKFSNSQRQSEEKDKKKKTPTYLITNHPNPYPFFPPSELPFLKSRACHTMPCHHLISSPLYSTHPSWNAKRFVPSPHIFGDNVIYFLPVQGLVQPLGSNESEVFAFLKFGGFGYVGYHNDSKNENEDILYYMPFCDHCNSRGIQCLGTQKLRDTVGVWGTPE